MLSVHHLHCIFVTGQEKLFDKTTLFKTPFFCASFWTVLGQQHSEEAHLSHSFTSGMHYQKDLEAINGDAFGSLGLPSLRVGLRTIQTERAPPLSRNKKSRVSGGSRTEKQIREYPWRHP